MLPPRRMDDHAPMGTGYLCSQPNSFQSVTSTYPEGAVTPYVYSGSMGPGPAATSSTSTRAPVWQTCSSWSDASTEHLISPPTSMAVQHPCRSPGTGSPVMSQCCGINGQGHAGPWRSSSLRTLNLVEGRHSIPFVWTTISPNGSYCTLRQRVGSFFATVGMSDNSSTQ